MPRMALYQFWAFSVVTVGSTILIIIASILIFDVVNPLEKILGALFTIGLIWLGISVWRKISRVEQPERVRSVAQLHLSRICLAAGLIVGILLVSFGLLAVLYGVHVLTFSIIPILLSNEVYLVSPFVVLCLAVLLHGLYLRQVKWMKISGTAGLVLAIFGMLTNLVKIMNVIVFVALYFITPPGSPEKSVMSPYYQAGDALFFIHFFLSNDVTGSVLLASVAYLFGIGLFGFATFRARQLSGWGALFLMLGAAIGMLGFFFPAITFNEPGLLLEASGMMLMGAGFIWLSIDLCKQPQDKKQEVSAVLPPQQMVDFQRNL